MLKHGSINKLNVHGLRKVNILPPYFTVVEFDLHTKEKTITDWVYENLESRFWMGQICKRLETKKVSLSPAIAFEDPAESTYFLMFLSQINKSNY
ncbi:hypothetical protein UFOVP116_388 [uncultured Caudovirales phage]|uniref:Uncharacterized protein n=1 Tax=uncultured Caudovirales phage TaxID=2100421 RepID=A0A6J5LB93_9CAUD|nr:hypothetical protein UFOVP116_388 [uncultured Caudovirales phage]